MLFFLGCNILPLYLPIQNEVKEQLADAATHTRQAYAKVRRSRQPDADTELGRTEFSKSPGVIEGTCVSSNEVLLMKPIMRFLQLLCENHNRDLQVKLHENRLSLRNSSCQVILQTLWNKFNQSMYMEKNGCFLLCGVSLNHDVSYISEKNVESGLNRQKVMVSNFNCIHFFHALKRNFFEIHTFMKFKKYM